MTTCAHCHEPFTPKRRTARYCGDACRVAAHRGTPPERGTDHRSGATGAVLALRPTQAAKEPALAPKALPVTLREPISRPHKLPSGAILVSVRETEERAGQFEAWVADQLTTSHTPLLATARVLLAEGADPETKIVMRHDGDDFDSLSATVGGAATLVLSTSSSGRPIFARYRDAPRDEPIALAA